MRRAKVIFPALKDIVIDRFSHFVFKVSVTQGATIYDVALESLINCLTLQKMICKVFFLSIL